MSHTVQIGISNRMSDGTTPNSSFDLMFQDGGMVMTAGTCASEPQEVIKSLNPQNDESGGVFTGAGSAVRGVVVYIIPGSVAALVIYFDTTKCLVDNVRRNDTITTDVVDAAASKNQVEVDTTAVIESEIYRWTDKNFTRLIQSSTNKVGPEARALGLGRAWLGLGPGLGVFTSPSPSKPGPDPGWARAAGPDGPLIMQRDPYRYSGLVNTVGVHDTTLFAPKLTDDARNFVRIQAGSIFVLVELEKIDVTVPVAYVASLFISPWGPIAQLGPVGRLRVRLAYIGHNWPPIGGRLGAGRARLAHIFPIGDLQNREPHWAQLATNWVPIGCR
ncbi:hypothetical protein GGX14DRAFT_397469 [Mycena pura]|uniref:Uncharacterized protein n=1 Tax=Mycena pura TaxID=153505 RepID=A0AAD6VCC9_9AGAR|nr:hypothetical protein GGX14DRAFT_397469 [Mycena pura]